MCHLFSPVKKIVASARFFISPSSDLAVPQPNQTFIMTAFVAGKQLQVFYPQTIQNACFTAGIGAEILGVMVFEKTVINTL